jgi:hypothetical protein
MFMTFDSDSYIRLAALARRARHVGATQHGLRTSPVLWAHTQSHWFHWRVDAPAGGLDTPYEAEWYEYPLGIAYLLRSVCAPQCAWQRSRAPQLEPDRAPRG